MATLKLLLLLAALILFLIAAYPPMQPTRLNLVALGLAAWVATLILP